MMQPGEVALEVSRDELGERLSAVRLVPATDAAMEVSLRRYGQLSPLVVFRDERRRLEVIDGFRRLRAAGQQGHPVRLQVRVLDVDETRALTALFALHRGGTGLTEIEEAWVVQALVREQGMAQAQVGQLLRRHQSWVSRRLLLVEALAPEVQMDVRLGLCSPTAAREVARLPRGIQQVVARIIAQQGMSTRAAAKLVAATEQLQPATAEEIERLCRSAQADDALARGVPLLGRRGVRGGSEPARAGGVPAARTSPRAAAGAAATAAGPGGARLCARGDPGRAGAAGDHDQDGGPIMSSWKTRTELEHHIVQLLRKGRSQREISRALGVTRGLVKRVVDGRAGAEARPHTAVPETVAAAPRPFRKLDVHEARMKELLAQYPSLTAQRVFEELRAAGYQGGYSIIKVRVRKLRPPKAPEPSRVRPVFGPGQMGEQDWSPYKVDFIDATRTVHAFMLPLSHSRRRYADFFEGEDLFALLEGHRRAFEHFPGVPHGIRYDNQKAVVARREGPDVIYQPRLLAFATHLRLRATGGPPGKAQ
jgi:transposase/ParB-like chromosome segregation protein Spo0J